MDPISAAIVAGLVAGVTEVGKNVIGDAYNALKAALQRKFGSNSDLVEAVEHLEKKPDAPTRQAGVEAGIKAAKADQDPELLAAAKTLLDALQQTPEGQQVMAKYHIEVKDSQIGVMGDQAHVEGGIHFGAPHLKPSSEELTRVDQDG